MKNHSRHLHAPLCVIFVSNSGYIARYAPFIWHKSPTNCDAHLTESIFQTSSRTEFPMFLIQHHKILKILNLLHHWKLKIVLVYFFQHFLQCVHSW